MSEGPRELDELPESQRRIFFILKNNNKSIGLRWSSILRLSRNMPATTVQKALMELVRAGLLINPRRGVYKIAKSSLEGAEAK